MVGVVLLALLRLLLVFICLCLNASYFVKRLLLLRCRANLLQCPSGCETVLFMCFRHTLLKCINNSHV